MLSVKSSSFDVQYEEVDYTVVVTPDNVTITPSVSQEATAAILSTLGFFIEDAYLKMVDPDW